MDGVERSGDKPSLQERLRAMAETMGSSWIAGSVRLLLIEAADHIDQLERELAEANRLVAFYCGGTLATATETAAMYQVLPLPPQPPTVTTTTHVAEEKSPKTPAGHKARHVELHKALDELFADFISHNPDLHSYIEQPILALLKWSNEQQHNPTECAPNGPHG